MQRVSRPCGLSAQSCLGTGHSLSVGFLRIEVVCDLFPWCVWHVSSDAWNSERRVIMVQPVHSSKETLLDTETHPEAAVYTRHRSSWTEAHIKNHTSSKEQQGSFQRDLMRQCPDFNKRKSCFSSTCMPATQEAWELKVNLGYRMSSNLLWAI